ncbi:MAG TPA: PqiC family protein [Candidatus Binataceae bacterium]|nr:PqiC family protein [Candidatus Binataceae bacterium]
MNRAVHFAAVTILAIAVAGASGCSIGLQPRPDESKFFVLAPVGAAASTPPPATSPIVVGVGPIKLPDYLERQEIVTRVAPNRMVLSGTDRWAEGLDGNFTQVLAQDLGAALGTQRIVFFPWYQSTAVDYQVRVDVYRFEGDNAGTVTLTAHWQILDGAGKMLYVADSTFTATAASPAATAVVAAMSTALGDLTRAIASEIESLNASKK